MTVMNIDILTLISDNSLTLIIKRQFNKSPVLVVPQRLQF